MSFQGSFLGDWTPTKYEVRVRRIKDVFGNFIIDFEKSDSGGSGFFDSSGVTFFGLGYGLYEAHVTAYLKLGSQERVYYGMLIKGPDSVYIDERLK